LRVSDFGSSELSERKTEKVVYSRALARLAAVIGQSALGISPAGDDSMPNEAVKE